MERTVKIAFRPLFAGTIAVAAALTALPASADVFSSQRFDGGTADANALPGVNLDAVPGVGTQGNDCVETQSSGFSMREGRNFNGTVTECRFGNFSISTTNSNSLKLNGDRTYNYNPPPWAETWRP